MLLFDEDEDEDDEDEDEVCDEMGEYGVDTEENAYSNRTDRSPANKVPSLGKRLLLKRRHKQTTTVASSKTSILPTSPPPPPSQATPMATGRSIGIDLGTTFSAVSVIEGGKPVIIPINGSRIVPSVVAYTKTGGVLVGEMARRQFVVNTANSFASVKRIIGRTVKEVKAAGEKLSVYKIDNKRSLETRDRHSKGKGGKGKKSGGSGSGSVADTECELLCPNLDRPLTPEDVSAEVLKSLVSGASQYLGEVITRAVITVPAYFLPAQCDATIRAGQQAGLERVKLLREPEAAALAYGLTQQGRQIVLVFDLGGGTFDVSVLEVGGGFVEVIATSGDPHLGGDDFDAVVVDYMVDQFGLAIGDKDRAKGLLADPVTTSRLYEAAVDAKIRLSSEPNVTISVPFLIDDVGLTCVLKRSRFESLSRSLLVRLMKPLREVAVMAGINLPGESGQMGVNDDMFYAGDEGDEGAAGRVASGMFSAGAGGEGGGGAGAVLSVAEMKKMQLGGRSSAKELRRVKGSTTKELRRLQKETMDSSLATFPGGQALDDVILVGGSTRIPAVQRLVRTVTGVDPRRTVNPDEAVSLGAAVMAGILDGDITDMQVLSAWQAAMYRAFYEEYRSTPTATAPK